MNMNPKNTPTPPSGSASIKSQGVYKDIAGRRYQRTLSNEQLDPVKHSKHRRAWMKTGKRQCPEATLPGH